MSTTLQIQLPGETIPVRTVQVKTDVPKILAILKNVSSGK